MLVFLFVCPESFFSLLWFQYLPLGQSWGCKPAAYGAKTGTPCPGSPPGGWVCPQVGPLLLEATCGVVGPQFSHFPVHRSQCGMLPNTPDLWEAWSLEGSITFSATTPEHFSILCGSGRRMRDATASWQSLMSPSLSGCPCQSFPHDDISLLPLSLDWQSSCLSVFLM